MTSCSVIMSKVYGVNNIKAFSQEDYDQSIAQMDSAMFPFKDIVANQQQYELSRHLGIDSSWVKDFSQPVQILYFLKGELVSFHANCYAPGGASQLNWNYEKRFETEMPISAKSLDGIHLSLVQYSKIYSDIEDGELVVLVFWTRMFEKIAFDAIEVAQNHLKQFHSVDNCRLYLINSDHFFASLSAD